MAVYYSLPRVKLHEKKKMEKLKNLPSNFKKDFYQSWVKKIKGAFVSYFQRKILFEAPKEDVKNYLLATTEFGKEIQSDIDLYITLDD